MSQRIQADDAVIADMWRPPAKLIADYRKARRCYAQFHLYRIGSRDTELKKVETDLGNNRAEVFRHAAAVHEFSIIETADYTQDPSSVAEESHPDLGGQGSQRRRGLQPLPLLSRLRLGWSQTPPATLPGCLVASLSRC
jgi:hypothetical protein